METKEIKIGYKLVCVENNKSGDPVCTSGAVIGYLSRKYKLGKKTKPKKALFELGYGLLICRTVEEAYSFSFKYKYGFPFRSPQWILECEYGEEMLLPEKRLCYLSRVYNIADLKRRLEITGPRFSIGGWPEGSVMVDWVKPIRVVRVIE